MVEEKVLQHFQNNATTSTRAAKKMLFLSHSTVWRVLHKNDIHSFHVQRVQVSNVEDYFHPKFATSFLHKEVEQPSFPSKVIFSDEALFTREGIFDMHNLHLCLGIIHKCHEKVDIRFNFV